MRLTEIIEDLERHVARYGGEEVTENVNTRDLLAALKTVQVTASAVGPQLARGHSEIVRRKIPDVATAIRRLNTRIDDGCFLEADEYAIDLLIRAKVAAPTEGETDG